MEKITPQNTGFILWQFRKLILNPSESIYTLRKGSCRISYPVLGGRGVDMINSLNVMLLGSNQRFLSNLLGRFTDLKCMAEVNIEGGGEDLPSGDAVQRINYTRVTFYIFLVCYKYGKTGLVFIKSFMLETDEVFHGRADTSLYT